MLVVHHLQRSQSERIVWLCEELGIPYELKTYPRDTKTFMCPPELQALHPTKAAPVIQDGKVTLAESGAIVEYILTKYGHGKLAVSPSADDFPDYLYFFHFANGYFQSALMRKGLVIQAGLPAENRGAVFAIRAVDQSLQILEDQLTKHTWLAGEQFTAADIMNVCCLTTMRIFFPYSLEEFPAITAYLTRVGEREAYQRAVQKGDPGLKPLTTPEKPIFSDYFKR